MRRHIGETNAELAAKHSGDVDMTDMGHAAPTINCPKASASIWYECSKATERSLAKTRANYQLIYRL